MTVSIRSVLHNTQFKRADPVVEVEGKDLDTPVRWVFTNEREDVSSFLSGGEMLIIEGNALLAADWHGTLGQYVASLAQAGVAALVVELVEGCGADAGRTGVCGQAAWVDVDWFEISRTFCRHLSERQYRYRARTDALAIGGGHNVHFIT